MKKTVAVLAVLMLVCAGALYAIGNRAEALIRADIAGETMPGSGIVVTLTDYHRHLFGAQARFCLRLDRDELAPGLRALDGQLCMNSDIHYGPLLLGPRGPALGWAWSRSVIDVGALPEAARRLAAQVFADAPPVVIYGRYRFDGGVSGHGMVTPFDYRDGALRVRLGGLVVDGFSERAGALPTHAYINLRDLKIKTAEGSVTVASIDADSSLSAVVMGELPIEATTLALNGVSLAAGGKPLGSGNATLRVRNQVNDGLLSTDLGLWLDGVQSNASEAPLDTGYLGLRYRGLDAGAMVRLRGLLREARRLQGEIAASSGDADADTVTRVTDQVAGLRELFGRMMTVASSQLLRPGESGVHLQMMLDKDDQRRLTLDGSVRYQGLDGRNPAPAEWRALPAAGRLRLADVDLHLNLAPVLLPPSLRERGGRLLQAGVMVSREGRLATDLTIHQGDIMLNRRPRTLARLLDDLRGLAGPAAPRRPRPGTPPALE